ncbi:MAG: hypothetical protein HKN37_06445 [Rhodothermales bacterium]|nr:hypothetical protein [Rhodothermales bacterium]
MRVRIVVLILTLSSIVASATAQQPVDDSLFFRVGEVTENVTSGTNSSRHYAVYLPKGYAKSGNHPVVFLMDPRGVALRPLELFRETAERLGYVLMSSYDTLSDADSAYVVNDDALSAMLVDAQVRFAVDPARLYLAGFSGTAHYSWAIAAQLDGHVAGIIGAGDGLSIREPEVMATLRMTRPPVYFGTAGVEGFNYDGARMRDLALDTTAVGHRFATFDGGHSWPPRDLADMALSWIHLRAMRSGLIPVDSSFVDSLFAIDSRAAREMEDVGLLADAARRYREIAADYQGLADVKSIRMDLGLLALKADLRHQMTRREQLSRRALLYTLEAKSFADTYRDSEEHPSQAEAVEQLRLVKLVQEAADESDPDASAAARRMLASAFSAFSFYEARRYLAERDFERAAGVLRIALAIRPGAPFTCLQLARAEAQLSHVDAAIEALTCAVNSGRFGSETLASDPLLVPIRSDPRVEQLLVGVSDR